MKKELLKMRNEKKERVLTSKNMRYSLSFICNDYLLTTNEKINISQELYKKLVTYINREYKSIEVIEELNSKVNIKETTKENTNWKLQLSYRL